MHMIKQDQSKVHNMDLLWRYYEKNRNFGKAAHVLARLADMHRFGHNNWIIRFILVDVNISPENTYEQPPNADSSANPLLPHILYIHSMDSF